MNLALYLRESIQKNTVHSAAAVFQLWYQQRNFENLTLGARQRTHFQVYWVTFPMQCVFLFYLKPWQGVWSWEQAIFSLVPTHEWPRLCTWIHLPSLNKHKPRGFPSQWPYPAKEIMLGSLDALAEACVPALQPTLGGGVCVPCAGTLEGFILL